MHINEILPEYDFSHARRNKYASRYTKGRSTRTSKTSGGIEVLFRDAIRNRVLALFP